MYCWGDNSYAQLGDGTTIDRLSPTQVRTSASTLLSGVAQVASGECHTCARMSAGGYRCWGRNANGQLGDGTTTDAVYAPAADLVSPIDPTPIAWIAVSPMGYGHTCLGVGTNDAYCMGSNWAAQLGASGVDQSTPWKKGVGGVFTDVCLGWAHTVVLRSSLLRVIGSNSYGQLGVGSTSDKTGWTNGPTVTGLDVACGGNFTCVRTSTGVRCWGANDNGMRMMCMLHMPCLCYWS